MNDINKLEERIKYHFTDKKLINTAITHSSKCSVNSDGRRIDNERLEFIGDAMLDAIIGVYLYKRFPDLREGELSKLRAQIVCENSLASVGRKIEIGKYLLLGEGEIKTSGRDKPSVIADSVEALIGAIFLDGGYEKAETFVSDAFCELITSAIEGKLFTDYKTKLQEEAQRHNRRVEYVCDEERGPDHEKTFFVHVMINGKNVGSGFGRSKKEAEQNAARDYYEKGIDNVL